MTGTGGADLQRNSMLDQAYMQALAEDNVDCAEEFLDILVEEGERADRRVRILRSHVSGSLAA